MKYEIKKEEEEEKHLSSIVFGLGFWGGGGGLIRYLIPLLESLWELLVLERCLFFWVLHVLNYVI